MQSNKSTGSRAGLILKVAEEANGIAADRLEALNSFGVGHRRLALI
jgi:hypothetical protein